VNDRVSILGRGKKMFSSLQHPADPGAHPAVCPIGTGALSLVVKRTRREADNSRLSTAEVKNEWSSASIPTYIFLAWCLISSRDVLTSTLVVQVDN
jgi:hypothetical protein